MTPLLLAAALIAADEPQRVYLIGNSLTADTLPDRLDGEVAYHIDCGKPLRFIEAHPESPCVKRSTLWPAALKEKTYDVLVVQPHYGATLSQDVETIGRWVRMQPEAEVVVHTGWARRATLNEEYADRAEMSADDKMTHSPAYYDALLAALRRDHPGRSFRLTDCTDALNRIAADVEAGTAPIESTEPLYRDAIHMSHGPGRYLMHNLMRRSLGQPPVSEWPTEIDAKLKAYLDRLIAEAA